MSIIDKSSGKENPKDAAGRAKTPLHLWPATASAAGAVGLYEGMLKYGRNNFRATDVAASVYVAAAKRHVDAWFEGGDNWHLGNALACLAILVDTSVNGTMVDDRNYVPEAGAYDEFSSACAARMDELNDQYSHLTPKHWDARDMTDEAANLNVAQNKATPAQEVAEKVKEATKEIQNFSDLVRVLDKVLSGDKCDDPECEACHPKAKTESTETAEDVLLEQLRKILGPDIQIRRVD